MTFVDGLGVGDVQDVALRDRRRLSEDGVLIIVTTLASSNGGSPAPPELIARGFGESEDLLDELRAEAARVLTELEADDMREIKLLQEHLHDARRPDHLRPHPPPADDPPSGDRGMTRRSARQADSSTHAPNELTARRLVAQLRACEVAALAFCRLLERWGRGEADPSTAGGTGRRRCAGPRTASRPPLPGSTARWRATCSSSRPTRPRAARGTAGRAPPSSSNGSRCSCEPASRACPNRVAAAYLELAVLVRALQGLSDAARVEATLDALVALGGPLRPARHAARRHGRRPARDRCVGQQRLHRIHQRIRRCACGAIVTLLLHLGHVPLAHVWDSPWTWPPRTWPVGLGPSSR